MRADKRGLVKFVEIKTCSSSPSPGRRVWRAAVRGGVLVERKGQEDTSQSDADAGEHWDGLVQRFQHLLGNGKRFVSGNELRSVVVPDADEAAVAANTASTTSGSVITAWDSCACDAASDFSLPKKTTKNSRKM